MRIDCPSKQETVASNIRYLARQCIPLSRNWNSEKVCEVDSNFHQLNLLRSSHIPGMEKWFLQNDKKYTNEI